MTRCLHIAVLSLGLSVASVPPPTLVEWPGTPVVPADVVDELGPNISGLHLTNAETMWAVRDAPSALLLVERSASGWRYRDGWDDGRPLRYADGRGAPDAEAVTATDDAAVVFVGAERDNSTPSVSRNTILRYDTSGTGPLVATDQWDLDVVLPRSAANQGIEGLAWIPSDALSSLGIVGEDGERYRATDIPDHEPGLFVVGLEGHGSVTALALGPNGLVEVVASVATGLDAVTELAWSPRHGHLWAVCDNTCGGRAATLGVRDGRFEVIENLKFPDDVAGLNLEGFSIAPTCVGDTLLTVWSDDNAARGHALRKSSLDCAQTIDVAAVPPALTNAEPGASTAADASPGRAKGRLWLLLAPLTLIVGVAVAAVRRRARQR